MPDSLLLHGCRQVSVNSIYALSSIEVNNGEYILFYFSSLMTMFRIVIVIVTVIRLVVVAVQVHINVDIGVTR